TYFRGERGWTRTLDPTIKRSLIHTQPDATALQNLLFHCLSGLRPFHSVPLRSLASSFFVSPVCPRSKSEQRRTNWGHRNASTCGNSEGSDGRLLPSSGATSERTDRIRRLKVRRSFIQDHVDVF